MKKLFILLTGIIALCSAAVAGCGVKNSEQTFEPNAQTRTVAEDNSNTENDGDEKDENGEVPDEDGEHCKEHCRKKMPRVILKHGNGASNGVQFFAIRFGGECPHKHHKHDKDHDEPAPEPLPEETPEN